MVVIALGLSVVYYYMNYYLPSRDQSATIIFNKEFADLKSVYFSGDYSNSIQQITSLIQRAPSKEDEGYLKIFLAAAYLHRNQQDDTALGIKTYKEIINGDQFPARVRARALIDIAAIVRRHDLSFYRLYFPEMPFSGYIPSSGDDYSKLRTAYFDILKLSDQTSPTSQAEYAIAGTYYAPMIANGYVTGSSTVDAAKQMRQYVTEGDSRADASLYSPRMLLLNLMYKSMALGYSALFLHDAKSYPEAEASFKNVLALASRPDVVVDPETEETALSTRFFYADFLLSAYGDKRSDDIRAVLAPFSSTTERNVVDKAPYVQQQAAKLAAISPALKAYLQNTGY
ncbi:MAG: hypothetical protein A2854_02430 [Parcubacteria group bacterium RIFCSPHIGHO2_01_FULL_56_18]|nr:MAG: hypothetical protein A2854_02430 [Parcubacteria group bacterium RIFCSPHIGHO2_01_FULL_56_18]